MIELRIVGLQGMGTEGELDLDELSEQIHRTFAFAFDRFAHAIREGDVSLTDLNGPRGGIDKACRIQLRLLPRGVLVARGVGESPEQAAREACEKMKEMLTRRLSKRRSYSKAAPPVGGEPSESLVDGFAALGATWPK